MKDTTVPLLATGSHYPMEGVGCVMNLMSWEQGRYQQTSTGIIDTKTNTGHDHPNGYIAPIRSMLIVANDTMCSRKTSFKVPYTGELAFLLCPECSNFLIDLAHKLETPDKEAYFNLLTSEQHDQILTLIRSIEKHVRDLNDCKAIPEYFYSWCKQLVELVAPVHSRPADRISAERAYELMTAGR